jgi:Mrp family chromosome partitioning ATPase
MKEIGLREIEEIVIAISSSEKRIIGFTSPEPDGLVCSVAQAVAEFLARSGRSVLLIDLQQAISESQGDHWTVSDMLARRNITHLGQGLDLIATVPNPESRYAFSDTGECRNALEGLLESYQFIILELAPVVTPTAATLNPLPLGAACHHVLLTCRRGATKRSELRTVAEKLRAARCVIGGLILNETGYSSPGVEIARVASWFLWPVPGLKRRAQNWALKSDLLN